MNANDHDEPRNDFDKSDDDPRPEVVSTTDPVIETGRIRGEEGIGPDETIVAETSHVTHDVPIQVHLANVVIEHPQKEMAQNTKDEGKNSAKSDDKAQEKGKGPKADKKPEDHSGRNRWINIALTGVVALVCGVGGAWAFNHFDNGSRKGKDDSAKSQTDRENDKSKQAENTQEIAVTKADLDDLKKQIQGMSSQYNSLNERLDSFGALRNDMVRDVGSLQVKIKEVSHAVEEVADVPKRIQPLQGQVDRLQEVVNDLSFQIAGRESVRPASAIRSVGDRQRSDVTTPAVSEPILASPMIPADGKLPNATMDAGVSFFKKSDYIQAEAIFKDLRIKQAGDARVWYFSALAHGLVTNTWDGETLRFVMEGAEREQKGSPSTKEIDEAFAGLTPQQGKDWLAAYRARLVKH
jgi:uncharacterized protein YoxC